jgi:hypothetical protein
VTLLLAEATIPLTGGTFVPLPASGCKDTDSATAQCSSAPEPSGFLELRKSAIAPHNKQSPHRASTIAAGMMIGWPNLCSAESRSDLTLQFLRANIHGAARREHLAPLSGNRLATHDDGCLDTAAACCRNPECLVPGSHGVVPDCSGEPTPARSSEDASGSTGSRNPSIHGGSFP